MERRIEQDVEGWPTRPFEDGHDGLRQLASADFSGVVRAEGTWLFFVNGKIVGVFEGEIEDVADARGTAHKAPHPSLPLLYAMQATGGDTRAKYYTNDTPISEVDDTLSSGSFTGYVELGENVLSGDYYQLYHGGRSMSVAFVGNSGKMITGDEAFERADDEIGIYEVVDVDVAVTGVPGSAGNDADGGDAATAATAGGVEDASTQGDTGGDEEPADDGEGGGRGTTTGNSDDASNEGAGADEPADATVASATTTETPPAGADADTGGASDAGTGEASDADTGTGAAEQGSTATESSDASAEAGDTRSNSEASTRESTGTDADPRDSVADGAGTQSSSSDPDRGRTSDRSAAVSQSSTAVDGNARDGEPLENEAAWREATTVPSLDPDRSEDGEPAERSRGASRQRGQRAQSRQQSARRTRKQSRSDSGTGQSDREQSTSSRARNVDDTLEEEVLEREDRIDRLQQRVQNLDDEREDLADERDRLADRVESLTEENESLRGEIRQLEQEVEELEATATSGAVTQEQASSGEVTLAPRAALEQTDLFVRYDSKSVPTLEAAHDGSADAPAVNQNLRLDVHTQFEETGATVGGEEFGAFLEETMAYRFVEWLVRTLPYEIRETNSQSALRDLFDAVPEIDRVEFHGAVARDAVEGEEGAPSETFDVVVRDKMGEALLVANMNEERDPATGRMIVDLQEAASRVKEHSMALAGAFFVTRSFFEPAALETASEATSGSLLSRDSRRSYVKLSRKQGYHLCLVEARGDDLHLNVPEL